MTLDVSIAKASVLTESAIRAFLFWREEFLRNRWLIGQFVVLAISFIDLLVSISTGCFELYRIRRFFRPYFLISGSQMLKKTIKCLWNTLPELLGFLLLLMLWILSATVVAMCLFSGPLRQKSYHYSATSHFYKPDRAGLHWLYETFYNLIVLLTTANHPDVILPNYSENRAAAFFDIGFLAVGTYIFMNIFTAIMYNQFRGYLLSSVHKRIFRRRVAIRAAFEVLKSRDPIPVVEASKLLQLLEGTSLPDWKKSAITTKLMAQYEGGPVDLKEFMDIFRLLDLSSSYRIVRFIRCENLPLKPFQRFRQIMAYEALQLVAFENADEPNFTFLMINTCFAALYIVENGFRLWVHGWRNSLLMPLTLFDVCVSVANLALRLYEIGLIAYGTGRVGPEKWSPYDFGQLANLLVILRTLRFMQISNLMTSVLFQMPHHLAPVLGVLISFYYVYALLGFTLFHGTVERPANGSAASNETYACGTYQQLNYWSINFDDFAASIFTLWSLMVLNNWHVIVQAFTDKIGRWVHVYMLSWWLIASVILLTLITAMIIEEDEGGTKAFYSGKQVSQLTLQCASKRSDSMRACTVHCVFFCPFYFMIVLSLSTWFFSYLSLLQCILQSFLFARQLHTHQADLLQCPERRRIYACRSTTAGRSQCHAVGDDRRRLIDDSGAEELSPAFELSVSHDGSSRRRTSATAATAGSEGASTTSPSATVVLNFTQMFGGGFEEPTNEELVRHLQCHAELSGLVSS
ncbi:unnamed protein product [Hydatigera taeniaeformis]|uniref:Ion_trans domain-containing protein n=1 Tax=Hydatigena taeniaeformis TaxID=6205 RepID=A0A158RDD0_HYDTA|nr:unnamed protein product [Hydatigera taeniaeformis]